MQPRYRTALIGFGKIGAQYVDDALMARHYPVATHAQALRNHPRFDWCAVVDPRHERLAVARDRWGIRTVCSSIEDLVDQEKIDVVVLATPPDSRLSTISLLPNLRAVVVEKPLGLSLIDAKKLIDFCQYRNIIIVVNYWRRFDEFFNRLAMGGLEELVGTPQAVFGVYGNGLLNNGSHMIDFCRMLFGEITAATALGRPVRRPRAQIENDIDVPFHLKIESGLNIMFQPVNFSFYRENSMDIWGTRGRLQLVQEGLRLLHAERTPNRAMTNEFEVPSDSMSVRTTTVGSAFQNLYHRLSEHLDNRDNPIFSLGDPFRSEQIVDQIFSSTVAFGPVSTSSL
jgi:predicted dehydrogenase